MAVVDLARLVRFGSEKEIRRFLQSSFRGKDYLDTKGVLQAVARHLDGQTMPLKSIEERVKQVAPRIGQCLRVSNGEAKSICRDLAKALIVYA